METEEQRRQRINRSILYYEYVFNSETFNRLTHPDRKPDFEWQRIYQSEMAKNGKDIPQDADWPELHFTMREKVVLMSLIERVEEYAKEKAPAVWDFIVRHIEDFSPSQDFTGFARVPEGENYVQVNPGVLLTAVTSRDQRDLAEALAGLAHEAKHIEFNQMIAGRLPREEGIPQSMMEENYAGALSREEACYRFHEEIYRDLTGEEPRLRWEDVEEEETEYWGNVYGSG